MALNGFLCRMTWTLFSGITGPGVTLISQLKTSWCVGSFWDNVRAVYGNDIAARYKELRDKKIISADWVYDMSTHIQTRYPADAYENELAKWSVTTPALLTFQIMEGTSWSRGPKLELQRWTLILTMQNRADL
jgi:hypothetical protein